MPLVPFASLMADAARGRYAVGYFESWNLESLLAVADAAEASRSPVILGFSGIYLPHPGRVVRDGLDVYAAIGRAVAGRLPIPACLLFNESPHLDWVFDAIGAGFNLVMFSDEALPPGEQAERVREVCTRADATGCAVEGEVAALPGVGGQLSEQPADRRLTDVEAARAFVEQTGVDALAVNVGQLHLHGRQEVGLDLDRLRQLRAAVDVPLVLHGATSVRRDDLREAVRLGVGKINVGSALKRTYYDAMRAACAGTAPDANPYEVIGSGLAGDVLTAGRVALRRVVEDFMALFGSTGRA